MMLLIQQKASIYVRSGLAILTTCCHCQSSKLKKTFVVFSTSGKSKICFIFTKLMTKLVLQNFGWKKKQITKLSFHRNLPTTTEEGGIPGVALEICGVRRELGVLREVLLEVTRLGPGAGVLRKPPGVCALLELLKMEEYTHLQYLAFRDPSLCTKNYGVY